MEMRFIVALEVAIAEGPSGPGHVVPGWLADSLTSWAWHVQDWDEDGSVLLHATEAGIADGTSVEEVAAQWAAWAEAQGGDELWRPLVTAAGTFPCLGDIRLRTYRVVEALRGLAVAGRPGLALAIARALVEADWVLPDTVREAGMFPDWP